MSYLLIVKIDSMTDLFVQLIGSARGCIYVKADYVDM